MGGGGREGWIRPGGCYGCRGYHPILSALNGIRGLNSPMVAVGFTPEEGGLPQPLFLGWRQQRRS